MIISPKTYLCPRFPNAIPFLLLSTPPSVDIRRADKKVYWE